MKGEYNLMGRFYEKSLNMEKVNEEILHVINNLNLREILKMIREISYDQVCYYDENTKGIIFSDPSFTQIDIENATLVQRKLRDVCDYFDQIIIDHHQFDQDYLREKVGDESLIYKYKVQIEALQEKIAKLEDRDDD